MADAVIGSAKCLLPNCSGCGSLQLFKVRGIKKLIDCATERHDDKIRTTLQSTIDSQGEQASVELHKSCYCSYTSKDHIRKVVLKKKLDVSIDSDEPPSARTRRSQVHEFDFKKQCLFCTEVCNAVDPKHPDRWDRVAQCERKGLVGAEPFKDVVLDYCSCRNDARGMEVALRCSGVHELAAAEAQYHIRCYDDFRKMPACGDQTLKFDDNCLKLLCDDIYVNRKLCTWTSVELHDKYVSFGRQLTRKQLLAKLVAHFGDEVVVLKLHGCASIVGFKELVGKMVKIVKVDSMDEDEEDALVRTIAIEARAVPFDNRKYDLGDFTFDKTKEQTSATLLRFISKLTSNSEVTKTSLSLAQCIQSCITNTHNQATLGLGVKLHHKFGSSDLIHTLYDHGFSVSYDEVLRFRKSAAKYVSENAATLHRMMGLTRTVGIVFGWYDNFDLLVSTPNGRRETHSMATEFQKHPAGIIEADSAQPGISTLVLPRLTLNQAKTVGKIRAVPLMHYSGPKKVMPQQFLPARTPGSSATLRYVPDVPVWWLPKRRTHSG